MGYRPGTRDKVQYLHLSTQVTMKKEGMSMLLYDAPYQYILSNWHERAALKSVSVRAIDWQQI